jgi:hypothetical protein
MSEKNGANYGYVYILGVKDIDLPVCKIGYTTRNPIDRCAEINQSSTGDFLWEVSHQFAVTDCRRFEAIVHHKLQPFRQRGREFFNLGTDSAFRALRSILESEPNINQVYDEEIVVRKSNPPPPKRRKSKRISSFRKIDSDYALLLQEFVSHLGVKGRPFGQLNKPNFGISDGNEGVQWNIKVHTDSQKVRVGVNLEGMKYSNWPIATFILSELKNPSIHALRSKIVESDRIFVRFVRDAWQAQSRPDILERHLGAKEPSLDSLYAETWKRMLEEALSCLNEEKQYRGRKKQMVTLANQPKNGDRKREMWVTPHIVVWTPVKYSKGNLADMEAAVERLKPVHACISKKSRSEI